VGVTQLAIIPIAFQNGLDPTAILTADNGHKRDSPFVLPMNDNFQIVAELNSLIQQQAEALKGHLGVLEVAEYANRARRIHELFAILERGPKRAGDPVQYNVDKMAVPLSRNKNV
jgi:hypothetical protein